MGSITIIVIIPLAIILLACSSVIGDITGGDKTKVVLPYEPEKGIVWECDIPIGPVELVESEIDGKTQVFYFESTFGKELIEELAGIVKNIITKEDPPDYEVKFGEAYEIIFTDKNGNEQKHYALCNTNTDSIYLDTVSIYAPDEYYAFDYTVTAQQPVEGEYFWFNDNNPRRTECFEPDYSSTKTFTLVHINEFIDSEKEYYYPMEYGYIDEHNEIHASEHVTIRYKITDGSLEILEKKAGINDQ